VFTGIIEELGAVSEFDRHKDGAKISISAKTVTEDTKNGDSIAVNGVCLTALNITPDGFDADVSEETLRRTTLGNLTAGARVNLERALTLSSRLGGHLVQGHVDGRGKFITAIQEGDFYTVRIGFPPELSRYLIHKGSVAVEGISLTIAELSTDHFDIAVIPKTWELTNLSTLKPDDAVNLEVDMIAKYVERMMGKTV
jgi:riboflavin synthase